MSVPGSASEEECSIVLLQCATQPQDTGTVRLAHSRSSASRAQIHPCTFRPRPTPQAARHDHHPTTRQTRQACARTASAAVASATGALLLPPLMRPPFSVAAPAGWPPPVPGCARMQPEVLSEAATMSALAAPAPWQPRGTPPAAVGSAAGCASAPDNPGDALPVGVASGARAPVVRASRAAFFFFFFAAARRRSAPSLVCSAGALRDDGACDSGRARCHARHCGSTVEAGAAPGKRPEAAAWTLTLIPCILSPFASQP